MRRSPFNQLDHFFDHFFDEGFLEPLRGRETEAFQPRVNVIEKNDHFELTVDLPGVDKKDVEIKVEDGYLTIKGERKSEKETKDDDKTIRKEIHYGSFERSWKLDESLINADKIVASSKDGVFTVTLPKTKESKKTSKTITIS